MIVKRVIPDTWILSSQEMRVCVGARKKKTKKRKEKKKKTELSLDERRQWGIIPRSTDLIKPSLFYKIQIHVAVHLSCL